MISPMGLAEGSNDGFPPGHCEKKAVRRRPGISREVLASNRAHKAAYRDEVNARVRARRRSDPDFRARERANRRRRVYGMSDPDYEALLARQGGVCAICGRKSRRRLVVDHCHVCDRVRGLLCHNCNLGLGYYCDDTSRLQAAIAYLQRSRRQPALSTGPAAAPATRSSRRRQSAPPILHRRLHRWRAGATRPRATPMSPFPSRKETP